MKPCTYHLHVTTWQEREVGCPLDHCECGTHDVTNNEHECEFINPQIKSAEIAAGWDSSP